MKPKIQYSPGFRGGYVIYSDQEGELQLYYEFGGGLCIAVIEIPDKDHWVKITGRPQEQRDTILTWIAQKVVRDQAPSGTYRITSNSIEILSSA